MLLGCVSGCGAAEGEASVQSVSMSCGLGSVGLADRFAGIVSPLGEMCIRDRAFSFSMSFFLVAMLAFVSSTFTFCSRRSRAYCRLVASS